jgi:hypothetical protein
MHLNCNQINTNLLWFKKKCFQQVLSIVWWFLEKVYVLENIWNWKKLNIILFCGFCNIKHMKYILSWRPTISLIWLNFDFFVWKVQPWIFYSKFTEVLWRKIEDIIALKIYDLNSLSMCVCVFFVFFSI